MVKIDNFYACPISTPKTLELGGEWWICGATVAGAIWLNGFYLQKQRANRAMIYAPSWELDGHVYPFWLATDPDLEAALIFAFKIWETEQSKKNPKERRNM